MNTENVTINYGQYSLAVEEVAPRTVPAREKTYTGLKERYASFRNLGAPINAPEMPQQENLNGFVVVAYKGENLLSNGNDKKIKVKPIMLDGILEKRKIEIVKTEAEVVVEEPVVKEKEISVEPEFEAVADFQPINFNELYQAPKETVDKPSIDQFLFSKESPVLATKDIVEPKEEVVFEKPVVEEPVINDTTINSMAPSSIVDEIKEAYMNSVAQKAAKDAEFDKLKAELEEAKRTAEAASVMLEAAKEETERYKSEALENKKEAERAKAELGETMVNLRGVVDIIKQTQANERSRAA